MNIGNKSKSQNMILDQIKSQSSQDIPDGIRILADAARKRHGKSVRAVLLYGSSMRTGNVYEGLADLYLLVDDYQSAFGNRTLAFFNKLLPPNVFYLEVPYNGKVLRAKYAVLTLSDFRKGTEHWFHSYLWGRFSQKTILVYADNDLILNQVNEILAQAVVTFVLRTLPQMFSEFTARDLWTKGLSLSYMAELRPEKADIASRLFDSDPVYYQNITSSLLNSFSHIHEEIHESKQSKYRLSNININRNSNTLAWNTRIVQGKLLSSLRLLKGLFTFKGGPDYIIWKIERHSGIKIEISSGLKRIPSLAIVVAVWRLYRKKAFR